MRKRLTFITLVLLSLFTLKTRAQNLHDDSIKRIAIADARKFKLDKARLTTFRQYHHNLEHAYLERYRSDAGSSRFGQRKEGLSVYLRNHELTSDYFKPVALAVSDTTLLTDPVYVKAYREKAWQRTRHRRTAGHYVLMAGVVDAAATVILVWAYMISHLGN